LNVNQIRITFAFDRSLGKSSKEAMLIVAAILAFVGVLVALAGHGWELTARWVNFFCDKDLNEELGAKLLTIGVVTFLAGIGLVYLFK
jgi:hypothetical protein